MAVFITEGSEGDLEMFASLTFPSFSQLWSETRSYVGPSSLLRGSS